MTTRSRPCDNTTANANNSNNTTHHPLSHRSLLCVRRRYVANDMQASAAPAVAFTLLLENTGGETLPSSEFAFVLPFSIEPESSRPDSNTANAYARPEPAPTLLVRFAPPTLPPPRALCCWVHGARLF